jgi:hypothetical protein
MPKRQRTDTGFSTSAKARIARAINAKINKKYPYSEYGRSYTKRGTTQSIGYFGPSYRAANAAQRAHRKEVGFIGRGGYWGNLGGTMLGRWAGNVSGIPYLDKIGGWAGSKLEDSIRGRGAYQLQKSGNMQHNQLINPTGPSSIMRSVGDETNDVMICHSEYLQDIIPSSAGFQTQFFGIINPGLSDTFPWLSQIAKYFEEYEFIQLVFEYKSVVTEGNSTASGTIIMATQYNPTNPAFTNKNNMENYEHANSLKVTDHAVHGIECDQKKTGQGNLEYIRTSSVPFNQDPKTYDLAVFQLATSGANISVNQQYGELWVHYKVRLSKTKVLDINTPSLETLIDVQTVGSSIPQPISGPNNYNNILGARKALAFTTNSINTYNTINVAVNGDALVSQTKNPAGPISYTNQIVVQDGTPLNNFNLNDSTENVYVIRLTNIPTTGNWRKTGATNVNTPNTETSLSAILLPPKQTDWTASMTIYLAGEGNEGSHDIKIIYDNDVITPFQYISGSPNENPIGTAERACLRFRFTCLANQPAILAFEMGNTGRTGSRFEFAIHIEQNRWIEYSGFPL